MRTLRSVLSSLARSPFKSSITLATVGLGVGVLIFALSISSAFTRLIAEHLERNGRVVMVANARWDEAGALESVKPSSSTAVRRVRSCTAWWAHGLRAR